MKDFKSIPQPGYLYGQEEALKLSSSDMLIEAKGPVPFSYVNIKKAKEVVLDYRRKNSLGTVINILPNPNLGKMKNLDVTLFNARCPFTGVMFGRYMGMSANNDHQWAPVMFQSIPRMLDLTRDADVADWMVFRLYKNLKGSYLNLQNGEKELFYVKDDKSEMNEGYETASLIVELIGRVQKLNADRLLMIAREMGLPTIPGIEKDLNLKDVTGFVMKQVVEQPKKVLEILSSVNAAVEQTISSALYSGILFQDHRGFSYKGNILGRSREEVVSFLQGDSRTFQMISTAARTADRLAQQLEKEITDKEDEPPVDDDLKKDNF